MACVYRHIRLDKNIPFYIGMSTNNKRPYSKNGRNNYWKNIIAITDYDIEILFEDVDLNFALEKEKEFITLYGRKSNKTGCLANMNPGGIVGHKGGSKFLTKEHRKKLSKKLKGKNSYMFGVKKTKEIKEKISLTKSKRVIDTKTMKIYKSSKEAYLDTKYSKNHLCRLLRKEYKNKTNMIYLIDYK